MSASNFTGVTPTLVTPYAPSFNVITTQSESMLKNYLNLSGSSPVYRYSLKFTNVSDDDHAVILSHWIESKGGAEPFLWETVPPYIDGDFDGVADGTSMLGHWVPRSFKQKPNAYSWDITLKFEAVV